VAHDFNNILTGILGYTEIVRSHFAEDDPLRAELEEVVRAAERGAALTGQLLSFGRKQEISPRVIDLNRAVTQSERLLARIIGEDLDLVFRPAEALWNVRADAGQIDQILINLATNARDAMPAGGKLIIESANVMLDELYCQGDSQARAGQFVMLAVSDTGEGIRREIRTQIFEPFFSTKPKGRGTGLGLATVYGIVRQSGGFIQVYSEPAVGTTIKVYLPRADGATAAAVRAPVAEYPKGAETVLLVEDEALVRGLAGRVLDTHGYTVLSAADAEEALIQCERHAGDVDLLLTDVILPATNGVELHDRLRDLRPGIKALFMSGYTDDVIAHHGVLREGMRFIQKPFTMLALTRKVRQALED
jgi:CheY-like chemotaxis protein